VRKNLLVIGIVALALLAGSTGAFADGARDQVYGINFPHVGIGDMYLRSSVLQQPTIGPVPLPVPQQPTPPAVTFKGPSIPTPSVGADATPANFGSALMTPRGAAMSSPKQLADRQIRRIIKRLD
jgi:hypothetical protein